MGYAGDGEGPVRRVRVDAFGIDRHAVSNAEFARFVEETGHVREAERFGWSFVFAGLLPDDSRPRGGLRVRRGGARSRARTGAARRGRSRASTAASTIPVVHVSWNDAQAYATGRAAAAEEAEWEYAARGGLKDKVFPGATSSSRAASTG